MAVDCEPDWGSSTTDTIYQAIAGTLSDEQTLRTKYELRLTLTQVERDSVLQHFHLPESKAELLQGGDTVTTIRQNAARMLVQAEAEHRHILCSEIPVSQAAAVQVNVHTFFLRLMRFLCCGADFFPINLLSD